MMDCVPASHDLPFEFRTAKSGGFLQPLKASAQPLWSGGLRDEGDKLRAAARVRPVSETVPGGFHARNGSRSREIREPSG